MRPIPCSQDSRTRQPADSSHEIQTPPSRNGLGRERQDRTPRRCDPPASSNLSVLERRSLTPSPTRMPQPEQEVSSGLLLSVAPIVAIIICWDRRRSRGTAIGLKRGFRFVL